MISLKVCEEILNKNGRKYSDAEIKIIRESLTKLSEIEYDFYKQAERSKEGSHLHQSIEGRTGNSWICLGYQKEMLKLQCQKDSVEIVEHFEDDGYSAKDFKHRPAFSRLIEYVFLHRKTSALILR